jgi:hypothetical protein
VLRLTSKSHDCKGSKFKATNMGAIMRVRAALMGLGPEDYKGTAEEREVLVITSLSEIWRGGDETHAGPSRILAELTRMASAVEESSAGQRSSGYHEAIAVAVEVITAMADDSAPLPAWEDWRKARAVTSGALPQPSAAEQSATRARMAVSGRASSGSHGRDGERISAMQQAASDVAAAARVASRVLTDTASEWRVVHHPEWRGGRGPSDGSDGDDSDVEDVLADGHVSAEEGPTDEEGAGSAARPQPRRVEPATSSTATSAGASTSAGSASKRRKRPVAHLDDSDSEEEVATQPTGDAAGADDQDDEAGADGVGTLPAQAPSIRFTVAGSDRRPTWDMGTGVGIMAVPIERTTGGPFGNPFPMGPRGNDGNYRKLVCDAHNVWLRLGNVPASAIRWRGNRRPLILQADGTEFPKEIGPRRAQEHLTGDQAKEALRKVLNENQKRGSRGAHTLRFVCSKSCGSGACCHGDNLADLGKDIVADKDARVAAAPPVKKRAVRKDKGVLRGPRQLRGAATYRIGSLHLHRYRFGIERQVSQATRDAVAEGQRLGVKPWLVAGMAGAGSQAGAESVLEEATSSADRSDDEADEQPQHTWQDDETAEACDEVDEGGLASDGGGSQDVARTRRAGCWTSVSGTRERQMVRGRLMTCRDTGMEKGMVKGTGTDRVGPNSSRRRSGQGSSSAESCRQQRASMSTRCSIMTTTSTSRVTYIQQQEQETQTWQRQRSQRRSQQ